MKLHDFLYYLQLSIISAVITFAGFYMNSEKTYAFIPQSPPTLDQLNKTITKAENYYQGLYRNMGNGEAVVAEYYSGNKSIYTVRHGVLGGIFYYDYVKDATKAAALKKFASVYGFNPYYDDHSFIWTDESTAPIGVVYTLSEYHDCDVVLPSYRTISPYHSKVCKVGVFGEEIYMFLSHFDMLSPIETSMQTLEEGKPIYLSDFEKHYNQLGFGVPICTPLGCSDVASTIRTAQFGALEMKLGNMQYADAVASDLVKAQNSEGAIYLSYDKNYKFTNKKSVFYLWIDKIFNDKPFYTGTIPTNAESMNDALAFLFQYRCQKYFICGK